MKPTAKVKQPAGKMPHAKGADLTPKSSVTKKSGKAGAQVATKMPKKGNPY